MATYSSEKHMDDTFYLHPTSIVDPPCEIGQGTKIWHFSHVMKHARIGNKCILGQNAHVASHVTIGNNVKIQNNVSLYSGCVIEDDVFLGPSCVFTNVGNPRSEIVRHHLYEKTHVGKGATIGANATIVCGITIGRYAFIAAGAVITKDVPDYALMIGVPARQSGWMSRHGYRLEPTDYPDEFRCPQSQYIYVLDETGNLRCRDVNEESPIP